ncbi:SOS response-associated peptidase [Marininema halotolerans]|uniref:Abasic site processing protein n=1 Tax=Marininema halotolerans TaxID=1155944 RepID=A0A1I6SIY9_9BACL|nr:SOS response-associated peptidase [Marininema halotolerans]SFS76941.1 Putative SOS response-associated peptidase YedK [Marininema halotolerans]
MCGRFTLTAGLREIVERFQVEEHENQAHLPRYNIAPTQEVPVILMAEGQRKLTSMRWGLIPRWAKDPSIGNRLINARSESLTQKPAFRRSFQRYRCLVPADSFYEWKRVDGGKQPIRIMLANEELFAFAGLWDRWDNERGESYQSFTIITTRANEKVKEVHERMPVILHLAEEAAWLDPDWGDPELLSPFLEPYEAEAMTLYPVSKAVNTPKNDQVDLIRPL